MIVVNSKAGTLFNCDRDGGLRGGDAFADCAPPYSLDELCADPDVCRRVGSIIAKAAERRCPQPHPAPRRGSDGQAE
jgi:hypothetical protein